MENQKKNLSEEFHYSNLLKTCQFNRYRRLEITFLILNIFNHIVPKNFISIKLLFAIFYFYKFGLTKNIPATRPTMDIAQRKIDFHRLVRDAPMITHICFDACSKTVKIVYSSSVPLSHTTLECTVSFVFEICNLLK